jgi:hypothetical protein
MEESEAKMNCMRCQELERELEAKLDEYTVARNSAHFRISRKLVAFIKVELERAKNELEEHRFECTCAVTQPAPLPTESEPRLALQEELQDDRLQALT